MPCPMRGTAARRRLACDGGGGPLGHPKVYLKTGDEGEIVCPYCSRRHILTTGFEHALTTGFGHAARD